jgi:hypothetical protein
MHRRLELSPESLSNAHHEKTIVLSTNTNNESKTKEQIGDTIRGIALRVSPKTPTNSQFYFFPNKNDDQETCINDLNILNSSFQIDNLNEVITENNDLKTYLIKVKSKFEMLLGECKEIENKLFASNNENEKLKGALYDIQQKKVSRNFN